MGQIQILDQSMVNMIAAGEVIERPASVVKELIENSIDSGATKITVSVEQGGRKLISITDDGCGMDAEDLRYAFEPHATSKIKTTKDLLSISTLGFRGEALASIAEVAKVRAVSRTKESLSGNCIEIDCGQKGDVRPCSADFGTTIEVRDLFYKLPARQKFLKTPNTEMSHIVEVLTRIALANQQIDLTFFSGNREVFHLSGNEGLQKRIAELFSSEISDNLIETESIDKRTGTHIYALLGKPQISRTNNKFQYIFLNGRYIRDKFISHAIKEAFRGTIEENRFPVVFLYIQMPCENFDVNVHPTKIEVRFYDANLVYSEILAALREKLLATDLGVQARMPDAVQQKEITDAMAEFFKRHRFSSEQRHLDFRSNLANVVQKMGSIVKEIEQEKVFKPRNFLQIHDSFIITETEEGFSVIDQHALHERIMYENLSRRIQNDKLESQKLLIPERLEVTDEQSEAIKNNAELIEKLGIEMTDFGPKVVAIQAFPVLLAGVNPTDFVKDLIDILIEKYEDADADKMLDAVLNMAACKAAIKAGQKLSDKEIEQLLCDVERYERAGRCPHGRPTLIKFSKTELEKQFKRT